MGHSGKESLGQSNKEPVGQPSSHAGSSSLGSSISGRSSASNEFLVPEQWKEDTRACIDAKVMSKESRGDISRTLVTLMTAKYGSNPGRTRCEEIARKLILKYPFMKDDLGSGYVRDNLSRLLKYICVLNSTGIVGGKNARKPT